MLFILIGGSGSGKSTLGKYLKQIGIEEIISTTTRNKRKGEVNGLDYYFVSIEDFNKLDKIESVIYSGNYYGITIKEFEDKTKYNKKTFIITDIIGANNIKSFYGEAKVKTIYIKTNLYSNIKRMYKRGDCICKIYDRVKNYIKTKEYKNKKCDYIIINKDLNKAKKALLEIIDKNN